MNPVQRDCRKQVQMLLLLASGGVVFLFVFIDALFPGMGYFLAEKYMAVPCLLFVGSALTQQRLTLSAKLSMLLSTVVVLWFVVVQMQHHLAYMNVRHFGIFAFVYLLGFPFAAVTEDGMENTGMKWIGRIYVASALILVIGTGMLLLDAVPEILAPSITRDGARAVVFFHPNRSGCALMIGIGFTLYFLAGEKRKGMQILLAVLLAVQFAALAMTNGRISILVACGLVGGTLFFKIWQGGWKRFLVGLAAALAVILVLFSLSGKLYDLNYQHHVAKLMEEAEKTGEYSDRLNIDATTGEVTLVTGSKQGELKEDLKTLNSRTIIWYAASKAISDDPYIKKWGTEYVSLAINSRSYVEVGHAHNSWVQTWMQMGQTTFILAVVYTLIAVINAMWLMFRKNVELNKKVVAMLVMCVLAVSFLEAYLFVGEMPTSFVNFIFFFCTGYLIQWNIIASAKRQPKEEN